MGVISRTLEAFRLEMRQSIIRFYHRRGLAGPQLSAFAQKLQTFTDQLRDRGASRDDIKKALAAEQAHLLQFPAEFPPRPLADETFLIVNQSAAWPEIENRIREAYSALVVACSVASEGHYAGLGTRLESKKPKFTMTAQDLLDGLNTFAERIKEQLAEHGGLSAVQQRFASLRGWTIGERIFLAKLFDLYKKASDQFGFSPEEFQRVVASLKFKIIVNAESGGPIIENFVKNNFFGLEPRNIIFMRQAQHPTLEVRPDGSLEPDTQNLSQGNHGLIPLQANLENQWFRIIPNPTGPGYHEETITTTDHQAFQAGITTLIVESVEDTAQYVQPYDIAYLAKVQQLGREHGVQMFMKIVGQKARNPQKGGFLATVTDSRGRARNAVLESNRAPGLKPTEITHLNQNRNVIYNPKAVDQAIMESEMVADLHPTFEPQGPDLQVRIDPKVPQGDRNLYLDRVAYIMDNPPAAISNLKDPADLIPTLILMERMEADSELVNFALNYLPQN